MPNSMLNCNLDTSVLYRFISFFIVVRFCKIFVSFAEFFHITEHRLQFIQWLILFRSCLRSSKEKRYKTQKHKLQYGVIVSLAVFPKPALLFKPGKASFHYPAFGNDCESM